MQRRGSLLLIALLVVAFFVLSIVDQWIFGPTTRCERYPVLVLESPRGTHTAEQEQRICEGDSELTTIVWLRRGKASNRGGVAESVLWRPSKLTSGSKGSFEPLRLRFTWLSDNELQITVPEEDLFDFSARDVGGVRVTFQKYSN